MGFAFRAKDCDTRRWLQKYGYVCKYKADDALVKAAARASKEKYDWTVILRKRCFVVCATLMLIVLLLKRLPR